MLDALLSALPLGLGPLVLCLGATILWAWYRRSLAPEARKSIEDRCYLLYLLAGLLLALNVLSWPILYLLLQSYVPEWPGVMCVYGVTQVGTGSLGASGFLPPLLEALQLTKPGLVFLSGAWGALYLLNRKTFTAPLTGRVLSVLLVTALLGTGDAAAELAYLAIPKKEDLPDRGCCTVPFDSASDASALQPAPALLGAGQEHRLWFHYYAINIGMILALGGARPARGAASGPSGWSPSSCIPCCPWRLAPSSWSRWPPRAFSVSLTTTAHTTSFPKRRRASSPSPCTSSAPSPSAGRA